MIPCLNPVTANVPDVEAFLKLAASGGFKGADHGANAWADWVAHTSLDHVRAVCAEQGCVIGHGGLPVNFREDDASFEMGLAALPAMAEVMQALCTRGMCTWIGPTVKSDPAAWRKVLVARL
ncbi:MAG: Sugar phosphate isomerase/epimerase, partial [Candidatus Hydrogenedentes bacterium]|nr:Sugar phosphate isomerase/epimerase [Candidatus Hydrogenedentota bacterium]